MCQSEVGMWNYENTHCLPASQAVHETQFGQCLPLPLSGGEKKKANEKDLTSNLALYVTGLFFFAPLLARIN